MTSPSGRRRGSADRGIGTIGTAAALVVFLLMMFSAVQVLFDLYATSMVTAAAHDAAREVAGHHARGDRCAATRRADANFADALGAYGEAGHARLEWSCGDPDVIRVRVLATHPSVLPPGVAGLSTLAAVDRTIEVRVEDAR